MTARTHFIDRLRVLLTALVICFHVAIAYGSAGGWYWREVDDLSRPLSIALTVFTAVCQAFFMGMFFLLAGYYTPRSLARKGLIRFTQDRLLRLGVPLLVYGLLIGPFTIAMARAKSWDGFAETLSRLLSKGTFNWGPLWFAQALLIFTAGFVVWQCATRAAPAKARRRAIPNRRWWLFAALAVGAGAWLIRLWIPLGRDLAGMTVGYFSSYVFLFFLGCVAWRHRWLEQVERQHAVPWGWVTLAVMPVLPAVGVLTGVFSGAASKLSAGGLIADAVYAFWEPFVAWGIIVAGSAAIQCAQPAMAPLGRIGLRGLHRASAFRCRAVPVAARLGCAHSGEAAARVRVVRGGLIFRRQPIAPPAWRQQGALMRIHLRRGFSMLCNLHLIRFNLSP